MLIATHFIDKINILDKGWKTFTWLNKEKKHKLNRIDIWEMVEAYIWGYEKLHITNRKNFKNFFFNNWSKVTFVSDLSDNRDSLWSNK